MTDVAPTMLISRRLAAALATPADYLTAIRAAFLDHAEGRYEVAPVVHISGQGGAVHVKSASRAGAVPLAVVKANANFPMNSECGLPTIQGFIALLDARNGRVLALMDSGEITARRTAAATAVAATHLARRDSRVVAIIGCGVQARYHVEALRDVLPLETVRCFDVRREATAAFGEHVRRMGLDVEQCANVQAATRDAHVIVTTTTSREPVLKHSDVGSGTFVAGVGADNPSKHELAPDLLRASRVVVDSRAQAATIGDLHHAIRVGAMTEGEVHGELADIVIGRVSQRADEAQCFVFDSTGLAIQDLAAAEMLYERARLSSSLPTIDL